MSILPPPQGLDLKIIATEQGFLNSFKDIISESEKAKIKGERLSGNKLEIMQFLINEMRRRIKILTPETKAELDVICQQANEQAMRHTAEGILSEAELLVNPEKNERKIFKINKLMIKIGAMQRVCTSKKNDASYFTECLNLLNLAEKKLLDSGVLILKDLKS